MDRTLGLQTVCISLTLLVMVWAPFSGAVDNPGVESAVAAVSASSLADADTMLGLTEEGAVLYQQDPLKLSGYQ